MQRTILSSARTIPRLTLSRGLQTSAPEAHSYLAPASTLLSGQEGIDGISCLVLNRAKARNALSRQMVDEMREAIARTAADINTRVLILHAIGPVFCAGADLRERKTMSQPEVARFLDDLNDMVTELENLPQPTIAAVPGPALGGGTELALGCDLRAGTAKTAFTLPETKLGIIPGAGGTQRLTHLLGKAKAMDIIFTGRTVSADEALRIGLLDVIGKDGQDALEAAVDLSKLMLTSGECWRFASDPSTSLPPRR